MDREEHTCWLEDQNKLLKEKIVALEKDNKKLRVKRKRLKKKIDELYAGFKPDLELERAAEKAVTTGNLKDLQEYLKLRRERQ